MQKLKRVFVTGAGGFVGRATVKIFVNSGWHVRAAVRAMPLSGALSQENLQYVPIGDIAEVANWRSHLVGCDVVVHLAARAHKTGELPTDGVDEFERINSLSSARLAEDSVVSGVKRLIFISSAGVMGERSLLPFREDDEPNPESEYAKSKYRAELALKAIARRSGMEFVILRPTLVYGAGNPGNLARLAGLIRLGLPLPFGGVKNQRSLLNVEQLARIIVETSTNPTAANQTFLVSDGMDVTTSELLEALASAMGVRVRLFRAPPFMLRGLASLAGKRSEIDKLLGSFCVDSALIRQRLAMSQVSTIDAIRANSPLA